MNHLRWRRCAAAVCVLALWAAVCVAEEGGEFGIQPAAPAGGPAVEGERRCRCVGEADWPTANKIEQTLRNPLTASGINFIDAPLEEVVNHLQEDYGIPIQVDAAALDDVGLGPDEPVTASLHNISLRSALRLMLSRLGLTYIIRDEVLLITTQDEAKAYLVICVYDVRDLVTAKHGFKPLVEAITGCVAPDSWHGAGGAGSIRELPPGLLIVAQSQHVHGDVRGLLTAIREVDQGRPANAKTKTDQRRSTSATAADDPFAF